MQTSATERSDHFSHSIKVSKGLNKGVFSSGYSIKDINKVLEKFKSSFESGNITQFVTLFDANVKTQDSNSRRELEADYKEMFNSTHWRKIRFKNASWRENDIGIIWGDIDFYVELKKRIDGKVTRYSGVIRMYFKKVNKQLVITDLIYEYNG